MDQSLSEHAFVYEVPALGLAHFQQGSLHVAISASISIGISTRLAITDELFIEKHLWPLT